MARENKIVKYGLSDEVLRLRYGKNNFGYAKIRDYIREKYYDIPELRDISIMSIKRFLESQNEEKVKKLMESGDIEDEIKKEFDNKMRNLIADAEKLNRIAAEILDKARNENASFSEISKLMRAYKESNDQVRKDIISAREFMEREYFRPRQNVIERKEIKIQNFFLTVLPDLCPRCKSKIDKKLEELLELKEVA